MGDNLMKNKKSLSIRAQLLLMSILPVVIIGAVLLIVISIKLKSGMMEEALDGLMASAELFRAQIETADIDLTTNALEDSNKAVTGYDFTRFEGDTRASTSVVKADGTRPIGTQAAAEVVEAVLKQGKNFTSEKTDVAGKEYCVAYAPIKDASGAITGMAFAGKPTADMEATIRSSIISIVIIGVVIIIVTVAIVIVLANKLVGVVVKINNAINQLADGQFEKMEDTGDRGDELGEMMNSSNALIDVLTNVINDIKNVSSTLREQSDELSETTSQIKDTTDGVTDAVAEIARGAQDQNESLEKVTQNVDTLSAAIRTVAENAEDLAGSAADMSEASQASVEALQQLSTNMDSMGHAVAEISSTMEDTNRAVRNVNEKVDGITSIASQTNLLALNASIEAARAGEAGRGFAVVAEEIGLLASESSRTADEIRSEMATLLERAGKASEKAQEVSDIGNNVTQVLEETVEKINNLIDGVNSTVDGVNNISALTEECDASKVVIVDAVNSFSAVLQEYAATTEETSASMQEMNKSIRVLAGSAEELMSVAGTLDEDLEFFKL